MGKFIVLACVLLSSFSAMADCDPEGLLRASQGRWAVKDFQGETTFQGQFSGSAAPWSFFSGKLSGFLGENYTLTVAKNQSVVTGVPNYSLKLTNLRTKVTDDYLLTSCRADQRLLIFSRVKNESLALFSSSTVDMFEIKVADELRFALEGGDLYCTDSNGTTQVCGSGAYAFRILKK